MSARRILVADDQPHMIRVLTQFLEGAGYQVETAGNGQLALDAILRNPPDLLLTDIQMPRMDGQQLCAALQEKMPGRTFPIIVMTSVTDAVHRTWTEAMPNTILLEKPLSMRQLLKRLETLFAAPCAPLGQADG